jgi:hypothetical protein
LGRSRDIRPLWRAQCTPSPSTVLNDKEGLQALRQCRWITVRLLAFQPQMHRHFSNPLNAGDLANQGGLAAALVGSCLQFMEF